MENKLDKIHESWSWRFSQRLDLTIIKHANALIRDNCHTEHHAEVILRVKPNVMLNIMLKPSRTPIWSQSECRAERHAELVSAVMLNLFQHLTNIS